MKSDEKGFTLVELIIAVAILAIVMITVCGFIIVASRSYTSANMDIMLQQEAQLALNRISDVIIDTTDSINYGDGTKMALKDDEFDGEPEAKILVVVNRKDGNSDNPSYRFDWNKEDEAIYFNTSDTVIDADHPEPVFNDDDRALLAQHVKEVHFNISQFARSGVVMISLTFENGGREYTTSNNVTVRNRVALNKIHVEPMKRADTFTITPPADVILEPGDRYTFPAPVVDGSDKDKSVRWEMDGGPENGSSITEDGNLVVGKDETRQSFTVKVTPAAYQDESATKKVRVYVKRVTGVQLSRVEGSIKPGSTVTVEGIAQGNLLGSRCAAQSCMSDNLDKDWELCGWKIVENSPAEIVSSDGRKAEIKIASNANAGDEIVVEAVSALAASKDGGSRARAASAIPSVNGRLTLKVSEGVTGDYPMQPGLKFCTDNDETTGMTYDYMYDGLREWDRYVMCVRVRELDNNMAAGDRVAMYYTEDKNIRFLPDMFGLELNRSYQIFFQLLVPVSNETIENHHGEIEGCIEDGRNVIVDEYMAHTDVTSGKYIGERYQASALFYGRLEPPSISLKCNGVVYPNDNPDYCEHFSFTDGSDRVMEKVWIGDVQNIMEEEIRRHVRFSVYKGEGEERKNWTWVCGYNPETMSYESNEFPGGCISVHPGGGLDGEPFMRKNNDNNIEEACGTYHIVTGYEYQNNSAPGEYDYLLKYNLGTDFSNHYYEQPQCTMTLKIDMGLNLRLPDEQGQERWTVFPVPSDRDFPFELQNPGEQSKDCDIEKYAEDGSRLGSLGNGKVTVTCKYLPGVNGSGDSYTVTLASRETSGKMEFLYNYGTYKYEAGKDKWSVVQYGTTTCISHWKACIELWVDGHLWKMELPLPSEDGFPSWQGSHFVKDMQGYLLYETSDQTGEDARWTELTAEYDYDSGKDVYTVTLKKKGHSSVVYGKWECASTGSKWVKID